MAYVNMPAVYFYQKRMVIATFYVVFISVRLYNADGFLMKGDVNEESFEPGQLDRRWSGYDCQSWRASSLRGETPPGQGDHRFWRSGR